MALNITITDAGRAEIINANNTGTAPVTLTHIGFTAAAFTPNAGLTALPSEIKRVSSIAGEIVAPDTISVTAKDEGQDTYTMRGFGIFTGSGTLFAVYGQADPIIEKSSGSTMLLTIDVVLADIDAASLEFGDISFSNPPASLNTPGVVTLSNATDSTAQHQAATPRAVKSANDNANTRLAKNQNLADLTSAATARVNLGLGTSATLGNTALRNSASTTVLLQAAAMNDHRTSGDHDDRYPQRGNNLSDLPSPSQARSNLGLGASATMGTTASRTSSSTATVLQAKAMNDHRQSDDHDGRYPLLTNTGSAAARDVQENATDNTSNRLMEVGAFGIGSGVAPYKNNLNDLFVTGIYRFDTSTLGAPPQLALGIVFVLGAYNATQIAVPRATTNSVLLTRSFASNEWGEWVELYHSGNLSPVEVSRQISTGDGLKGGGNLESNRTISVDSSVLRKSDIQTEPTDNTAGKIMAVGAFGIGVSEGGVLAPDNDIEKALISGFYQCDENTLNMPIDVQNSQLARGTVYVGSGINSNTTTLIFVSSHSSAMYMRRRANSAWQPWVKMYHGDNLNPVETSRQVISGDGLEGGGSLATNRTLSVDSSVVRTSRTITAGSGLTGGGNLSSNRTLSVDSSVLRANQVQNSYTDDSIGKLLTVGAFGLGGGDPAWPNASLLDTSGMKTGFYRYSNVNDRPSFAYGAVLYHREGGGETLLAIASAYSNSPNPTLYVNRKTSSTGSWSGWVTYYHTGNLSEAFPISKGESYWHELPNGWIEQGMNLTLPGGQTEIYAPWPTTFPTRASQYSASRLSAAVGPADIIGATLTRFGITINLPSTTSGPRTFSITVRGY
ncbi:tail fiber protein [Halomonas sp. SIMBA_159]